MPSKKYQDRALWVYVGNNGRLKAIKDEAKRRGLQPSKYLMAAEDAFRNATRPKPAAAQDIQHIQEENRRLATELHESEHRIAHLEADLRRAWSDEMLRPEGDNMIDQTLITLIRSGPIHDYKLLSALGLDPGDEASKGVSKQIHILEATGFISRTPAGWKWIR